jgi:energy-coupling factor transporter ATP-binding protein EcfA2
MHVKKLLVENLRAIRTALLEDLQSMVVIAGPNGCGKSTLFDAIRLIKSVYGGYQQNEWQHWFNEFQINLDQRQPEILGLLQNKEKPLHIAINIDLSTEEKDFLRENLSDLIRPAIWSQVVPDSGGSPYRSGVPIAAQLRQYGAEVDEKVDNEVEAINQLLDNDSFHGELTIPPDLRPGIFVEPSPVLQLIFSLYEPKNIGIIDFHGPQRTYQREQIGGVNLRLDIQI